MWNDCFFKWIHVVVQFYICKSVKRRDLEGKGSKTPVTKTFCKLLGTGMEWKIHSQLSGTGMGSWYSREWSGTGIPAHPCFGWTFYFLATVSHLEGPNPMTNGSMYLPGLSPGGMRYGAYRLWCGPGPAPLGGGTSHTADLPLDTEIRIELFGNITEHFFSDWRVLNLHM